MLKVTMCMCEACSVHCHLASYVKLPGMCCNWKIINFSMVTVTLLLHHTTPLFIIFFNNSMPYYVSLII